jgi:hypothetical protein
VEVRWKLFHDEAPLDSPVVEVFVCIKAGHWGLCLFIAVNEAVNFVPMFHVVIPGGS